MLSKRKPPPQIYYFFEKWFLITSLHCLKDNYTNCPRVSLMSSRFNNRLERLNELTDEELYILCYDEFPSIYKLFIERETKHKMQQLLKKSVNRKSESASLLKAFTRDGCEVIIEVLSLGRIEVSGTSAGEVKDVSQSLLHQLLSNKRSG